jgi:hypothetical protein
MDLIDYITEFASANITVTIDTLSVCRGRRHLCGRTAGRAGLSIVPADGDLNPTNILHRAGPHPIAFCILACILPPESSWHDIG